MSHINVQSLKLMHDNTTKEIKFSDTKLTDFYYDACIFSKVHRALIHNKSVSKYTISRQRLHWDTCDPIKSSLAKSIYMVIRVDKATNFYFIGFHKSKNTIPQTLFDTISKINKVCGVNTVKAIHSDEGSEFVSKDTVKWCVDRGIAHT